MRIFHYYCLLTLPLALCLASCTGENSENILTEMDEVVPLESYITYQGAKSATSEGLGFVCLNEDLKTETLLTGDATESSAFVIERTTVAVDGGELGNLITLLIEEVSQSGDTTFLGTDYAYCYDCLTSFEDNGTTMVGDFSGEFFQTDENGTDTPFGDISGSFNVLIDDSPFWCQ